MNACCMGEGKEGRGKGEWRRGREAEGLVRLVGRLLPEAEGDGHPCLHIQRRHRLEKVGCMQLEFSSRELQISDGRLWVLKILIFPKMGFSAPKLVFLTQYSDNKTIFRRRKFSNGPRRGGGLPLPPCHDAAVHSAHPETACALNVQYTGFGPAMGLGQKQGWKNWFKIKRSFKGFFLKPNLKSPNFRCSVFLFVAQFIIQNLNSYFNRDF